ncbi:hypothetical protein CPB85DRAFT_1230641 [Mucidula mucida]|nr:hypothetical protein CPB85DRAFT_1230641 [Mucidula mucida]
MSDPSWAPAEDAASIWYEQSTFVSTHLASFGYGIHVSVYSILMYYTFQQRVMQKRKHFFMQLLFNTAFFVLASINVACSIRFSQNAWINFREHPGGPLGYLTEEQTSALLTIENATSITITAMADGLLLFRVLLLWNFRWYLILFNGLFYLSTVTLSVLVVVQIAVPQIHMMPISFGVWLVLMVINIVFTAQIAGCILWHRRRIRSVLGPDHAQMYTNIAAIVIESALPFTILSIILLGLFGDSNVASNLFVCLLTQIACIGPEMIMLRVVLGRAWTHATCNMSVEEGQMQFERNPEEKGHSVLVISRETNSDTAVTSSIWSEALAL